MQRGGSSADTWVLTEGEVDRTSAAAATTSRPRRRASQPHASPAARRRTCSGWAATPSAPRTRRGWRGSRSKASMARTSRRTPLLAWLSEMAAAQCAGAARRAAATAARRVFERSLIAELGDTQRREQRGLQPRRAAQLGVGRARTPVAGTLEPDRARRAGLPARLPTAVSRGAATHRSRRCACSRTCPATRPR